MFATHLTDKDPPQYMGRKKGKKSNKEGTRLHSHNAKKRKRGLKEKNKQRENRGKIEGGGAEKGRGEQGPKKGDGVRRWTKKREGGRRKNQERAVRGSGEGHNVGVAADWHEKKWRGGVRKSEGRGRGKASRSSTHAT